MRRAVILAVALAGCLRSPDFHCSTDADCMLGATAGTCQSNDYCSFGDASCASGQRFGDLSGAVAGQCVGAIGSGADAGIDGMAATTDAATDAPAMCPSTYMTISGGGTHVYGKLATAAAWQTQVNLCVAASPKAYLAIPASNSELSGIRGLAGADSWVGIDDMATQGTYVTVTNMAATYLPWAPGQPDNSGRCVKSEVFSNRIATVDCATQLVAVCECVP